ncbi:MAG: hypothetical protein IJ326_04895 [Lachnospiraceae bacterium]|nr:hypothetical protein [Lachnospiraceae bacterium]
MKLGYRIGLFLLLAMIAVVLVLLMWKRQTTDELQQMENQSEIERIEDETVYDEIKPDIGTSQAQNFRELTTCNTICVYENLDKSNNMITLVEEKLPGKYIDMDREQLAAALAEDSQVLTLEEKEKGFCSQSLISFSSDRVKIARVYDTSVEEQGFYLMAIDHYVWVYKQDRSTLYFKTDLMLEELPTKLQTEIVNGKYMESEEAIYNFLESYSS